MNIFKTIKKRLRTRPRRVTITKKPSPGFTEITGIADPNLAKQKEADHTLEIFKVKLFPIPVDHRAEIMARIPWISDIGAVCFGRLPGRVRHALGLRDAGVAVETFEAEMADYDLLHDAAGIVAGQQCEEVSE